MSEEELNVYKNNIAKMFKETHKYYNKYFLLTYLDFDKGNYYTTFFNFRYKTDYLELIEQVISILEDIGEIKSIDIIDNETVYFWLDENKRYTLVRWDDAVIDI